MTPLFLLFFLLLPTHDVGARAPPPRPNIVLIMAEDLGICDPGCYGNATLQTPNIDRLAREGVKLTQHLAASPLCTPSRAAFLTGRYPVRSGMAAHGRVGVFLFSASSSGLPTSEVTFVGLLQGVGYRTALIGKWHLGLSCGSASDFCHHPLRHGFGSFHGTRTTNLRDCRPGAGSVFCAAFRALVFAPLQATCAAALTLALLRCLRLLAVPPAVFLLAGAVAAAFAAFLRYFRPANCFLMTDFAVEQQPTDYAGLAASMVDRAEAFIRSSARAPFLLFLSFIHVHTTHRSRHGPYGDAAEEIDWSAACCRRWTSSGWRMTRSCTTRWTTARTWRRSRSGARCTAAAMASTVAASPTTGRAGSACPASCAGLACSPRAWRSTSPRATWTSSPRWPRWPAPSCPATGIYASWGVFTHTRVRARGRDLMPLLLGRTWCSEHEFLFHYCNAYLNAVRWRPRNSRSVWKAFFTTNFDPAGANGCFSTHVCFCFGAHVTAHDPPLLFDLSWDPRELCSLSPHSEPRFGAVLRAVADAVLAHQASLRAEPTPPDQLSPANLLWKPWLQLWAEPPATAPMVAA